MEWPKKEQLVSRTQSPCFALRVRVSEVSFNPTPSTFPSSTIPVPPHNVGHGGIGPPSLPPGAACHPGCCIRAQVNLPTRGSRRTQLSRKARVWSVVSALHGTSFRGRRSICVGHISNDDGSSPHRRWPEAGKGLAERQSPAVPKTGGQTSLSTSVTLGPEVGQDSTSWPCIFRSGNLKGTEINKGRPGVLGVIFHASDCWVETLRFSTARLQRPAELSIVSRNETEGNPERLLCTRKEDTFIPRAFHSREAAGPVKPFTLPWKKKIGLQYPNFHFKKASKIKFKWFVLFYFETVCFILS